MKTLIWRGKIFWGQNLHYGLIQLRALITHSMAVAEQWKKVVYCFRSKIHLKPLVILHATCLALKIQWPPECHQSKWYFNDWKVIRLWPNGRHPGPAEQDEHFLLSLWCHVIILPVGAIKFCCCITNWSIFCRLHSPWQRHHPLFHRQISWYLWHPGTPLVV